MKDGGKEEEGTNEQRKVSWRMKEGTKENRGEMYKGRKVKGEGRKKRKEGRKERTRSAFPHCETAAERVTTASRSHSRPSAAVRNGPASPFWPSPNV